MKRCRRGSRALNGGYNKKTYSSPLKRLEGRIGGLALGTLPSTGSAPKLGGSKSHQEEVADAALRRWSRRRTEQIRKEDYQEQPKTRGCVANYNPGNGSHDGFREVLFFCFVVTLLLIEKESHQK
jgi:hypothetical protein